MLKFYFLTKGSDILFYCENLNKSSSPEIIFHLFLLKRYAQLSGKAFVA